MHNVLKIEILLYIKKHYYFIHFFFKSSKAFSVSLSVFPEGVVPEVLCEESVLKIFAGFKGKQLCRSVFFNKQACNFIKKETLTKVFSCEFCVIF